ncbi:MAG: tagaturonate epimerase family protein [Opitutaceae bacterium]
MISNPIPMTPQPSPLGLTKSFGFGDRLGLATPGHLSAVSKSDFAPIFAQQSIREMDRTQRTPIEVMDAARTALEHAGFKGTWGADADHLKTEADIDVTAAVGFCLFTLDPSAYVENRADTMPADELEARIASMVADGVLPENWMEAYVNRPFEFDQGEPLVFSSEELSRAAVKYGRAIHHCERLNRHIESTVPGNRQEIEVSVDETDSPTSPLEHLFFALELRRRKVRVVSLAPRFVGAFEKGIDYIGDLRAFESDLERHVAIARAYGPYKISIHSGSDKFSIYPVIGRVCGSLLHVKTAGTSYLEALRVVCRTDPALFDSIAEYSRSRFDADKHSYHISTTTGQIDRLFTDGGAREDRFLETIPGRQLLHVTFGSVLTVGKLPSGRTFHDALLENLNREADLYREVLDHHLGRHLSGLNQG